MRTWFTLVVVCALVAASAAAQPWKSQPVSAPVPSSMPRDIISVNGSEPWIYVAVANAEVITRHLQDNSELRITTPGDYYIGKAILIPRHFCRIILAPGVRLIRHSDYASAVSPDGAILRFADETVQNEGIEISGGGGIGRTSARVPDGQHTVRLVNYRRAIIRDIRFTTGQTGKYCVISNNGEEFLGENISFSGLSAYFGTKSDGLHFTGKHGSITLRNISGVTGDNMLAFGTHEGTAYFEYWHPDMVEGSIDSVLIDGVHCGGGAEPVRAFGRHILTLDISGANWNGADRTLTATGAFRTYSFTPGDTITLTSGGGAPGTYTIAGKVSDHAIRFVETIGASRGGVTASIITKNTAIRSIIVRNVTGSLRPDAVSVVNMAGDVSLTDGVIDRLEVDGVAVTGGSTGTRVVSISAANTREVVLRNINALGMVAGAHSVLGVFDSVTALRRVTLENCTSTPPPNSRNSSHMISIFRVNGAPPMQVDSLTLNGCTLRVLSWFNPTCMLNTDPGVRLTIQQLTGADNSVIGVERGPTRMFNLAWDGSNRIVRATLTNTTLDNVAYLCDAAGGPGPRSTFILNGLTIRNDFGGMTGRADAFASNVTRDQPGGWVDSFRGGNPTFTIAPQLSVVRFGYGIRPNTNDFASIHATSGDLSLNQLDGSRNVMGAGFLPRGYQIIKSTLVHSVPAELGSATGRVHVQWGVPGDPTRFTPVGHWYWSRRPAPMLQSAEEPAPGTQSDADAAADRPIIIHVEHEGAAPWDSLQQGVMELRIWWSLFQRG